MKKAYRKVAVVGRPNVGKSTLFNRLIKERKSIVDDLPGVTRDKLYADIDWNGKGITLIDTGGLVFDEDDEIYTGVKKQVFAAIEEADFVLFMVDGTTGITLADEQIAKVLRKIKNDKKIFLAVNKIDSEKQEHMIFDFYSLGLDDPYAISALSGSSGLADILDEVSKLSVTEKEKNEDELKVAIVGKPNVGKSSILNCLAGKERSIVTSIAGTTRDSLDSSIKVKGKNYIVVDTAGLRRKSKVSTKIERYSNTRAISSIERADVVVFVVESVTNISDQDQKIASLIKKREKPTVIVINKWDLVEEKVSSVMNSIEDEVLRDLQFINYSKVLFTSALTRKNLNKIWDLIDEANANANRRVSTSKLNKALEEIILLKSPPADKRGKRLRLKYVTQSDVCPPEIVFFVNDHTLVKKDYERFLEKELRSKFDFTGTPLKLVFRNKA